MRKAILKKFMQVLAAALMLNTAIFYVVASSIMLKDLRKQMLYTLEILDAMLDYQGDIQLQVEKLDRLPDRELGRFTVIRTDGSVVVDTSVFQAGDMDNHLEREEIQEAMQEGTGFASRRSGTTGGSMLYVACRSGDGNYLLRMATPFSGIREYLVLILPAIWLSFVIALVVSAAVAERFSASVTRPLKEISQEMLKVNGNYTDLHFEACQYPEINVIAQTTTCMSENVKEYLDQLEKERQIREEFFSNASHELKTPITSIQGYAELLENGLAQDEETRNDFVARIKKEAVHMTTLINDILMISRLETKAAKEPLSDVHMALVVEDAVNTLKPMSAQQQVTIHVQCAPVTIHANARQMMELVGNLLSNAVKYNRPGGNVWVNVRREGSELVVSVRDDGTGIPKESIPRIFERFYRVDKGRSRKQGGTGLGLSIVKHVVGYCQGSITVESEPDQGTEFVVRLPVK